MVLFLGFSHIFLGVLKKQLKKEKMRDNAYRIVILIGILLAVAFESARTSLGFNNSFNYLNLICSGIGVILGIGTFRLLYRTCC